MLKLQRYQSQGLWALLDLVRQLDKGKPIGRKMHSASEPRIASGVSVRVPERVP